MPGEAATPAAPPPKRAEPPAPLAAIKQAVVTASEVEGWKLAAPRHNLDTLSVPDAHLQWR